MTVGLRGKTAVKRGHIAEALSYRLQNSGARAVITNAQGLAKLAGIRAQAPDLLSAALHSGRGSGLHPPGGCGEVGGGNSIEVYIHRLRRKLEGSGVGIRTVRGLGYLLEADGT